MQSIGDFFARIKNLQTQKLFLYKIAQDAVEKHVGIELELSAISFRGSNLVIKGVSSTAKNQIFIKSGAILAEIAAQSSARTIKGIVWG